MVLNDSLNVTAILCEFGDKSRHDAIENFKAQKN